MRRVLKPGGRFLLITEVNHAPTLAEPNCILPAELEGLLTDHYDFLSQQVVRVRDDHNVYESVREGDVVDAATLPFGEAAIFAAHMIKRS